VSSILQKHKKILIRFNHGLGDSVQLSIVLKHIKRYFPKLVVDVISRIGKWEIYRNLADGVYCQDRHVIDESQYDGVYNLGWVENGGTFRNCPTTKVYECVTSQFNLEPFITDYQIHSSFEDSQLAFKYLESLPTKEYAVIHYQGNTSSDAKNLQHSTIRKVCNLLSHVNVTPVILDWDSRSPLPNGRTIFCPNSEDKMWRGSGTGDGGVLFSLISHAKLFIGIDSGPLHVAMATKIPILAVWTRHHPIHFADISGDTLHLIPHNHRDYIRADVPRNLEYFHENYRSIEYADIAVVLQTEVCKILDIVPQNVDVLVSGLRTKAYAEDYYEEHVEGGLDYLVHGDWQRDYGQWIVECFDLQGKSIIDLGCACGSVAFGMQRAGAYVHGIDLNNHMVHLGKQKFQLASFNVCDAVNLHLFGDDSVDFIHMNQTAEHFRPELVPFILQELKRILRPGGIIFSVHDTTELYEEQKRDITKEDPTHLCIRDSQWWLDALRVAGLYEISRERVDRLMNHPFSFLEMYYWRYWIALKSED